MAGRATAASLLAGALLVFCLPALLPLWVAVLTVAAGVFVWLFGRDARWLGALLVGFAWTSLHAGWVLGQQLPLADEGREVQVSGVVSGLPEVQPRRTRFRLAVDDDPGQPTALRGRTVQLSWYDDFDATEPGPRVALRAGERWQMQARVRAPRGLVNPGGFDSERHALAQRIAATGYVRSPEAATVLGPATGIDAWRDRMARRIARAVPAESSRYVTALALGDTRGLQEADWQALRATGLTHLIAISGFHVGMVAGFFALIGAGSWRVVPRLGRWIPRPIAAAGMALLGATGYAAVAGFALPTVRTVLMIAVVVLARSWRRPIDVPGSLALAALAVLLVDPLSVLAPGFWLSFAGVAWLAWCLPGSDDGLVKGFLSAQWVATLGLLPLTAMLFGQASLAGPLANLVAIPWWSLVVVPLALVGTGLEAVHAGWGSWAWVASAWCFDLTWPGFQWLASGRFSLLWLPESRATALPLALLGAFWLLLPRPVPGKPLALLLWLPLLWPARELPRHGEAELVMIDVGQGLALLVRTAGHALLYDAGPAIRDGFDAGERAVVPAIRALGSTRLDMAVLSHGDNDHAGGMEAVAAVTPIHDWRAPPGLDIPPGKPCEAGERWQWDGVVFSFLHPGLAFPYLRNESSCVLRVETAHGAMLLTGDIGEVIEQRLLRDTPQALRADVVVAPHHGSAGSSRPGFVEATGARLVLISAGHGNRFGHPRRDVVRRWEDAGAEVITTAEAGAARVWLGRDGLQLRAYRHWRGRLWDAAGRARTAAILSTSKQAAGVPED